MWALRLDGHVDSWVQRMRKGPIWDVSSRNVRTPKKKRSFCKLPGRRQKKNSLQRNEIQIGISLLKMKLCLQYFQIKPFLDLKFYFQSKFNQQQGFRNRSLFLGNQLSKIRAFLRNRKIKGPGTLIQMRRAVKEDPRVTSCLGDLRSDVEPIWVLWSSSVMWQVRGLGRLSRGDYSISRSSIPVLCNKFHKFGSLDLLSQSVCGQESGHGLAGSSS